ncbi:MAG: (Fe-S)-binding protein [Candidatus Bathyarchaeia archaeon]
MNREFGIAPYSFTSIIFMADGFFDGILRPSRELAPVPFACTLCGSCAFFCITVPLHAIWDSPAELVEGIRSLFIEEGALPTKVTEVLDNLASYGNPWRLPQSMKVKWEDECTVPVRDFTKEKCEYLLFMGDAAFIDETKSTIRSVAELLHKAGVNYGTLKEKEIDSGGTARELGEYGLFGELVEKNIKTFKEYGVRKVITLSPHDYHTFLTYYPKFGFKFEEVLHHTQFLNKLINEGKIKPSGRIDKIVTFHDSCILGRYYNKFEPPREIIKSIPGVRFVELKQNQIFSLCCGGGGGRMWYDVPEEKIKVRVSDIRVSQARDAKAEIITTACPYCKSMLLASENLEEIKVEDVAELLLKSTL